MIRILQWIIWFGVLAFIPLTQAEDKPSDLSSATVSVADHSKPALQKASSSALQEVLTKMSGSDEILKSTSVQKLLPGAEKLIQSYRYLHQKNENGESQLVLKINFDRNALQGILHQNPGEQKVWFKEQKPLTLVWLSIQNQLPISNDSDSHLLQIIHDTATQNNIPILFPEMGLQDQMIMQQTPQGNFNFETIQSLASRYGVQNVLVGQLEQIDSQNWQSKWTYWEKNKSVNWDSQNNDLSQSLTTGFNKLAANITGNLVKYSADSNDKDAIQLLVTNVNNINDYSQVVNYLKNLSKVIEVNISDTRSDSLLLNIVIAGGKPALIELLANNPQLIEIKETPTQNNLSYRWNGLNETEETSSS